MEEKRRLTRSGNGMIAGVCSGIADYMDWDPTLVRVGYILLSVFTVFAGLLGYVVLWIVMPREA
ncbi:MAG: PspC domain-containing protein [Tannerellaceae bacterium]|jgi:phage shock protein PspC (stress-responsive transcriptional regulator)|nr:PspC domain-containing protein [Tannerellaceae bacterium]